MFTCDGAHDHQDVDSFPTRRSSDLWYSAANAPARAASPTPMNPTPMNFGARCRMIASPPVDCVSRSEEHTSELQSHSDLVCRLLLEKKKAQRNKPNQGRI